MDQYRFRIGKGYVGQILNVRMIMEKMLVKDKVYAAFIDLEKAYNRIGLEAIWEVLKVYSQ